MKPMIRKELPVPPHYDPAKVGEVWRVPYRERAAETELWAKQNGVMPSSMDTLRVSLLLVDVQNTFCIPGFELYVGGRSGWGAVEDNRRLCEFIYRNLGVITEINPTMDTHRAVQIFHSIFLVNDRGEHPAPFTLVSAEDVRKGIWRFNRAVAAGLGVSEEYGQHYLEHYTQSLARGGKYDLTVWPYHAMLGSIGHALVSAVEEAVFFHTVCRLSQADFQVKGDNPLTENYSVISPEVLGNGEGKTIAVRNRAFVSKLLQYDAVIIAGQAKSHCVAWTIDDLLYHMSTVDSQLAKKVYLLEDCTSAVVVPGLIDYTDQAEETFRRFEAAGMHIVRSTDPIDTWPGIRDR